MIFGHQLENIIDVDRDLLYKLNFKLNIIIDAFFITITLSAVLIVQVKVSALIILKIALG